MAPQSPAVDVLCEGILAAQKAQEGTEFGVVTPPLVRGPLRRAMRGRLRTVPPFFSEEEAAHIAKPMPVGTVSLANGYVAVGGE